MPKLDEIMKRQRMLAAFGEFAINSENLDAVLMEACRLVGEATGTGRAKVLEIQKGRQELLVRAGVGWAPDVVGKVRLQMGERSSETYAIKAARPIVTQNIAKDDRFDVPHFMKQAGVVAFANVPIFVPGQRPYGILQIDDTKPREFGDDEIEFLQTYAMILGPVIDRLHLVEESVRDREVMRASEVRHRLLIESWAQAVWETDADGAVIADSPSWRAYTGQTLEQWLGYGWLDAIHPDERAYAERQWREAIAARALVNAEFRLRSPDGGWRWTNVRAAPVPDATGGIQKWVGMNIDINVGKSAEIALRDNEERQAFQLRLGDALASLSDPSEIQAEAARLVAERLDVGWCYFNEFNESGTHATVLGDFHRDGLTSMVGVHDLSGERDFLDLMGSDTMLDMPDLTSSTQFSAQAKATYSNFGIISALGAPLLRNGDLTAVLLVADTRVRKWDRGDTELLRGVAERTWAAIERTRAQAALRDSEERFRKFSDASSDILWIRDAKSLRLVFASPAFETVYQVPCPGMGGSDSLRAWVRLIEPEYRPEVLANFRRLQSGERLQQEFRVRRAADGMLRYIHHEDFPLLDSAGQVCWIAGVGSDVTDAKEFAGRQQVLVTELQHRTRNLIAVVRSLAERTIDNAASMDDFTTRFGLRLSALSRVQGLLSHVAEGKRVTFDELLSAELSAHGGSDFVAAKVTFDGPAGVPLRSGSVQIFALALHELATNAVKYGAFLSPQGHLRVTWRVAPPVKSGPPHLHVEWLETGVKMANGSKRAGRGGYGRELIERALPYQLGARTTYELQDAGVHCTIAVPIPEVNTLGRNDDD